MKITHKGCLALVGSRVNAVWEKGDYYNTEGTFTQVPDDWDMEELRQDETIYRPINKN